jgi:hypothetical protein
VVANLPPVPTTPVANFATCFASVVDTGGKFATSVNNTGGNLLLPVSTTPEAIATGINDTHDKFATGVNDTGLLPVSMATVANNGNNIRLLRAYSELEGKNVSVN